MKRLVTVAIVCALIASPLAGVAAGSFSTPDTTSDDLDIVFVDSSNNLKYVDSNGNVADTGVQATDVGGAGDWDGDGDIDVAIRTTGDDVGVVDAGGNLTTLGTSDVGDVGAMVDFDGDGDLDVLYEDDLNDNLESVDADGNVQGYGGNIGNVVDVGGANETDADGNPEVAYVDPSDNDLKLGDSNEDSTAVTTGGTVGGLIDLDGDGTVEIIYSPGTDLKTAEPGGTTKSLGDTINSAGAIGGGGDIDADGTEEVAYIDSGGTIAYVDSSGTKTDLGVSAVAVGAVVDFNDDGAYDDAPTVSGPSPDSTTVSSDPVTLSVDVDDPEFPVGDNASVDIDHNGNDVVQTTISSAQTVTGDVQDVDDGSNSWSVTVTDSEGNSNSYSYSYTADYAAPNISNPDPTGNTTTYDGDISVDVADADFATGDTVTVSATDSNGDQIGQTDISQNQTVEFEYTIKGGDNNITWTATDTHSLSDTQTQNFSAPGVIEIRNETNVSELVDSPVTVQVRFFSDGDVYERTTSSGTINVGGLPVAEPFIIEAGASQNFSSRTVYAESVYEQEEIYLLNDTITSVETRFVLDDPTGEYSGQSILYIDKPINNSGNITYKTIHADRFGVEGVTTQLEEDARYRIRIQDQEGNIQEIGPYRADVSEEVTVKPGEPSIQLGGYEEGWAANADVVGDDQSGYKIEYRYSDPANETLSLTVYVHEQGNTSNHLATNDTYNSLGNATGVYNLTANQSDLTWTVNFIIDRDGETLRQQITVSKTANLPPDLDGVWVQIVGVGMLLIFAGVFSVLNRGVGAVVTAVTGGILWFSGWLPGATAGAAVVIAIFVAVIYATYTSSTPG